MEFLKIKTKLYIECKRDGTEIHPSACDGCIHSEGLNGHWNAMRCNYPTEV